MTENCRELSHFQNFILWSQFHSCRFIIVISLGLWDAHLTGLPSRQKTGGVSWGSGSDGAVTRRPRHPFTAGLLTTCHKKMPLAPKIQKCRSSLSAVRVAHSEPHGLFTADCAPSPQSIILPSLSISRCCLALMRMHTLCLPLRAHCFGNHRPTNLIKTRFSSCWNSSPSAMLCHHHAGPAQFLPVLGSHTGLVLCKRSQFISCCFAFWDGERASLSEEAGLFEGGEVCTRCINTPCITVSTTSSPLHHHLPWHLYQWFNIHSIITMGQPRAKYFFFFHCRHLKFYVIASPPPSWLSSCLL